jgi:hypothetical protein
MSLLTDVLMYSNCHQLLLPSRVNLKRLLDDMNTDNGHRPPWTKFVMEYDDDDHHHHLLCCDHL